MVRLILVVSTLILGVLGISFGNLGGEISGYFLIISGISQLTYVVYFEVDEYNKQIERFELNDRLKYEEKLFNESIIKKYNEISSWINLRFPDFKGGGVDAMMPHETFTLKLVTIYPDGEIPNSVKGVLDIYESAKSSLRYTKQGIYNNNSEIRMANLSNKTFIKPKIPKHIQNEL